MAGDWIKIETTLPIKPEVFRMAHTLGIDRCEVVGRLILIWAWADQVSQDGHGMSVTEKDLDAVAGVTGFARALRQVDWLEGQDMDLSFPRFDRHNGQTSKNRALAKDRKQKQRRKVTQEPGQASRSNRDKSVTREEKRREDSTKKKRAGARALAGKSPPSQQPPLDYLGVEPSPGLIEVERRIARLFLGVPDVARGPMVVNQSILENLSEEDWDVVARGIAAKKIPKEDDFRPRSPKSFCEDPQKGVKLYRDHLAALENNETAVHGEGGWNA